MRRVYQHVPRDIVKRCGVFAKGFLETISPESLRRQGIRANAPYIERLRRIWRGQIGECALALHLGFPVDPWVCFENVPDNGYDLALPDKRTRIDVKTTVPPYRLIWPLEGGEHYAAANFTHLVAVSVEDDSGGERCWIEGQVTKQEFLERKRVADGTCGLEPNTWWMLKGELNALPAEWHARHQLNIGHRCHCGAWAYYGIGHSEMKGIQGLWFCGPHYREHKDAQHGSAKGLPSNHT